MLRKGGFEPPRSTVTNASTEGAPARRQPDAALVLSGATSFVSSTPRSPSFVRSTTTFERTRRTARFQDARR